VKNETQVAESSLGPLLPFKGYDLARWHFLAQVDSLQMAHLIRINDHKRGCEYEKKGNDSEKSRDGSSQPTVSFFANESRKRKAQYNKNNRQNNVTHGATSLSLIENREMAGSFCAKRNISTCPK